jgi:hypothetical protein
MSSNILYDFSIGGFIKKNFKACVSGIIRAIVMAHKSLQYGIVKYNSGPVLYASVNRSPSSYASNKDRTVNKQIYNN